ncbi:hypothetical protein [Halochromatium roseum]|uniref:hypothetical protein n=1 Tax=Halochromatium roseum TaxID=391920 RepID=UPI001911B587|nr:hypothetical protein [Halochromatium roseum]MBK5940578.1 hypothetical protein [Halochromatium roseum]
MSRDQRIPWHRLLGQALADALNGLAYRVSTEEGLALRSQRLDVLIIEQRPAPQDNHRQRRRRGLPAWSSLSDDHRPSDHLMRVP